MLGHVVTELLGHDPVGFLVEPHVIGVHVNHVLPARTGDSQSPLDIAKRLGDLILDRLGELPVVIPAALA